MAIYEGTIPVGGFADVALPAGDNVRISHDTHIRVDALYDPHEIPLYRGVSANSFPIKAAPANVRISTYDQAAFVAID